VTEEKTGSAVFGLDLEKMVRLAWRVFLDRPLTLLGVSCLVQVMWLPTHLLALPAFFWLPFALCIPYASILLLRSEKTDRIFLGWVDFYPRVLVVYSPAALTFLVLLVITGIVRIFVVQLSVAELPGTLATMLYWGRFFIPVLAESILGHMLTLAALLAVRKKLSPTEAILELFSSKRNALEVLLLTGSLSLFGMSGALLCCVGILATTTFSWICLGVAYYQIFEE
jgi:hypothetical protein